MLTDTSRSPHAVLHSLPAHAVAWTGGFWAHKMEVCRETMVPNMWRLLADDSISHNLANFRIAAGSEEGSHAGPPFGDGDFYKWLEAASALCGKGGDPELEGIVDEAVALIASVQREDGYIFTKQAIADRRTPGASPPLADQLNFEVYNLGHLMTAACVHFRSTGKRTLLAVAERAAGYLDATFRELSPEKAKTAVCPSHYMGIIELYRATGNGRYLDLAKRLIRMRDLVSGGTDDNQDRIPLLEQRKAAGHAVRANYLYAGVADLYAETGEAGLLEVLESCWRNVVDQKMYITGSCGALYDGVSPYGSANHNEIQRIHQAYGREYELPNVTAYNETCAAVGNLLWNWRMLNLSGDARFADVVELILYNGGLAGISLDGTKFFYVNALRRVKELPFPLKWSRKREAYLSSFCCPPNLVRTIAESASYAYALSGDSILVVLYGANRAEVTLGGGARVVLEQATDYPWHGRVELRIAEAPGRRFTLALRVPGWAEDAAVEVNGRALAAEIRPGSFLPIERQWRKGDVVVLHLPMAVRLMEANPLLEEDRNQVAVQRGPIVYCLEEADLPEGIELAQLFLPADITFRENPDFSIAGERMVALEGAAVRRAGRGWSQASYRPLEPSRAEKVDVRLVPYYAWDNRGHGEMSVWLPLWHGGSQG